MVTPVVGAVDVYLVKHIVFGDKLTRIQQLWNTPIHSSFA
jgi:hypothetical protein